MNVPFKIPRLALLAAYDNVSPLAITLSPHDASLGDAEGFVASRRNKKTLKLLGAWGNTYDVNRVAHDMGTPTLEFKGGKKIYTVSSFTYLPCANSCIELYMGDIRLLELKPHNKGNSYEIGLCLLPYARGMGVGKLVTHMMCLYAFNDLNASSIRARVYQGNERAARCLQAVGFKPASLNINDGYVVDGQSVLSDIFVLKPGDDFIR